MQQISSASIKGLHLIALRLVKGPFTSRDVMRCYVLEFIRLCKSCVWPSAAVGQIKMSDESDDSGCRQTQFHV